MRGERERHFRQRDYLAGKHVWNVNYLGVKYLESVSWLNVKYFRTTTWFGFPGVKGACWGVSRAELLGCWGRFYCWLKCWNTSIWLVNCHPEPVYDPPIDKLTDLPHSLKCLPNLKTNLENAQHWRRPPSVFQGHCHLFLVVAAWVLLVFSISHELK